MRSTLLLLFCLAVVKPAVAQSDYFVLKNTIAPAGHGAAAFGDVDADGQMDLFITGSGPAGIRAHLLRFEGLIFAPSGLGFTLAPSYGEVTVHGLRPVAYAAAAWADYDNDDDLDLIVAGSTRLTPPYEPFVQLFRHEGLMQLTPVASEIEPLYGGSVAWGDFDNDGRLDLLMNGATTSGSYVTRLYRNLGAGRFEPVSTPFEGKAFGQATWVDYDSDGDLDILLTGASAPDDAMHQPLLYRNDQGFSEVAADLAGCLGCSAAWADYDGDGDPDLLLSGGRPYPGTLIRGHVYLYRNDAGSLVRAPVDITPRTHGGAAWGDMNGDGRPDIVLNGATHLTEAPVAEIYRNTGDGTFERHFFWPGGIMGTAAVMDFDADGDLEFLASGLGAGGSAVLVHNQSPLKNTPPAAPGGLAHEVADRSATLRWERASDALTAAAGLTYNLRVGTSPGGSEVLSAAAVPGTGRRLVSAPGNVWHNTSWTLRNLPPGTYFWSVQSLDAAYAGSVFAEERTFVIR